MVTLPGETSSLRFEILGRPTAWRDGRELDLGPGKQRAVLAVLLLNPNRPVPTASIVSAVWGDDPPDNGTNVVQKYVAGLRRVLEPDRSPRSPGRLLTLTDGGYALSVPKGGLDAEVFQDRVRAAQAERAAGDAATAAVRLREALELWRGPALAGLNGAFFDSARERLNEQRAAALEASAEIGLELGEHARLVSELFGLVAEFPLREGLRYLLMLALYRCGRQAEALAAYRDARDFFAEEFGVEPGERLQNLHVSILRGDRSLAAPPAARRDEAAEQRRVVLRKPSEDVTDPVADGAPEIPPFASPEPRDSAPPKPDGFAPEPSGFAPPDPPGSAGEEPPTSPVPHGSAFSKANPYPLPGAQASLTPHELATAKPSGSVPPGPPGAYAGQVMSGHVPAAAHVHSAALPAAPRYPWPLRAVLVAIPPLTLGVVTWALVSYFAARRRSLPLALSAFAYLALTVLFFVGAEAVDVDRTTWWDLPLLVSMLGTMVGGAVHLAVLTASPPTSPGAAAAAAGVPLIERRVRREQARSLVTHYPSVARTLRIGRPDLPRKFDDGGLVDVNTAPEPLLASLPGLGAYHAKLIVLARTAQGPFGSVDDLIGRDVLPSWALHSLHDVLVAVPPPPAGDDLDAAPVMEPEAAPGAALPPRPHDPAD